MKNSKLLSLSKETLIELLESAIDSGTKMEFEITQAVQFTNDPTNKTHRERIEKLGSFLAHGNEVAYFDDVCCIAGNEFEIKSDEWIGKFKNLDINPVIDSTELQETFNKYCLFVISSQPTKIFGGCNEIYLLGKTKEELIKVMKEVATNDKEDEIEFFHLLDLQTGVFDSIEKGTLKMLANV